MTRDEFWRIIENARESVDDLDDVAEHVTEQLASLEAGEIAAFQNELFAVLGEAYRWDLWAAAYIVNGGCSDDGFEFFRGWLIAQGRRAFEAALANPAIVGDWAEPEEAEYEDILYAGLDAYEAKTGEGLPAEAITAAHPSEPVGEPFDEDRVDEVFPELARKFG